MNSRIPAITEKNVNITNENASQQPRHIKTITLLQGKLHDMPSYLDSRDWLAKQELVIIEKIALLLRRFDCFLKKTATEITSQGMHVFVMFPELRGLIGWSDYTKRCGNGSDGSQPLSGEGCDFHH